MSLLADGGSRCTPAQDLNYEQTSGDEVEDLAALLAFVQQRVPGVQAVASGAIASDYQRLRVEHVRARTPSQHCGVPTATAVLSAIARCAGGAPRLPGAAAQRSTIATVFRRVVTRRAPQVCARLGLVSLAYLWHQPQAALLDGMLAGGLEAVLVKVAALGLDPGRHLGRPLAAVRALLQRLCRCAGRACACIQRPAGMLRAAALWRCWAAGAPVRHRLCLSAWGAAARSSGLHACRWLWQRRLRQLGGRRSPVATCGRQFECNICGEGGEYETFTLDCPLFPGRRIVLDSWEARASQPRRCTSACMTPASSINIDTFCEDDKDAPVTERGLQVAPHEPGDIAVAAALCPTAFHLERKPVQQAAGSCSAPVSPAGTMDSAAAEEAGTRGDAAVIDVPAAFTPPPQGEGGAPAGWEPGSPKPDAPRVSVAVRRTTGGIFAVACAACGQDGRSGDGAAPSEAQTQAAVHAALGAIQAGAHPAMMIMLLWI